MDKLERLMNLTATLLTTGRPLSAEDLRDRIGGYPQAANSFRRQFERDKEALRELGIPLIVEEVPGEHPPVLGYRIDADAYYLDDPELEPDELAALHLASSLVRFEGGSDRAGAGLRKLGGRVTGADSSRSLGLAEVSLDQNLAPAFASVTEHRRCSIEYRGTERSIDPYRLDYQRGRWYLTALDHASGEERVFRLDRMEGQMQLGPPAGFDPPESASPGAERETWQLADGEPVLARLRVDADRAAWAVQTVGEEHVVEEGEDGSVLIELEVTHPEAFRSFALSFLDHAEVISPEAMREDIIAWLEQVG